MESHLTKHFLPEPVAETLLHLPSKGFRFILAKDYLELIDAARAQVDFWVNLGVIFILLQIEYMFWHLSLELYFNGGLS